MVGQVSDYTFLVPGHNAVQPNFMATLQAALSPIVALQNLLTDMPSVVFDLDTAVGVQLDQVGQWIGRTRTIEVPLTVVFFSWDTSGLGWEQGHWEGTFDPTEGPAELDDTTYRALLYAKAAANQWDGSRNFAYDILTDFLINATGAPQLVQVTEAPMEITYNVQGNLSSVLVRAIISGGNIPLKPIGVAVGYIIQDTNISDVPGTFVTGSGRVLADSTTRVGSLPFNLFAGQGGLVVTTFVAKQALLLGVAGFTVLSTNQRYALHPPAIAGAGRVVVDSAIHAAGGAQTWTGSLTQNGAGAVIANAVTSSPHATGVGSATIAGLANAVGTSRLRVSAGRSIVSGRASFSADSLVSIVIHYGDGRSFTDSAGNVYTITQYNGQLFAVENNAFMNNGSATDAMAYWQGIVWGRDQGSGNWYQWSASANDWQGPITPGPPGG